VRAVLPGTQTAQGLLALSLAVTAFFFVLVVMGWAPSPEAALPGLARRWGQAMRAPVRRAPFALGLLWGLLPCGLVIAALFNAAVGAAALTGAARMLAFGAGTLPTLAGVRWLAARGARAPRALTAAVLALIGVQFAFRGLASFGIVSHLMLGGVALW
jgi:sulfite exporter TauE/SafE